MAAMIWLTVVILLAAGYVAWRGLALASRLPEPGQEAPAFALPDQNGVVRALADFRGRYLVLYFFPRADTPG